MKLIKISFCLSIDHLVDFLVETVDTGSQAHVHEFRLSVHLEATEDRLVSLELNNEFFSLVLGVGLEGCEDLLLFVCRKTVG